MQELVVSSHHVPGDGAQMLLLAKPYQQPFGLFSIVLLTYLYVLYVGPHVEVREDRYSSHFCVHSRD